MKNQHQMTALAREFPADNLHVIDLPYRLSSWALDDPDNVRLWFDENQRLAAWAALQTPFWTIDCACRPEFESDLYKEIIHWADERACAIINTPYGHSSWFVMVFSDQSNRIRDLENAGYKCQSDIGEDSWSGVLMQRSIQTPVKVYQPPSGFVVRPLAGAKEADAYVELHRSVFESKNMTSEWRARTLVHPDYKSNLDIVVESPDGSLAAFCICWFDEHTQNGQVEPLGCHKDFRKYALGRVAFSEGLHRLQEMGAKNIFIQTDNYRNTAFRLYQSFDFEVARDVLVYRKDYETT